MDNPNKIEPNYNLLAKHFAKETSIEEIQLIEAWVDENPINKKSYDSMYFLWMQSSKKEYLKKINVDNAWEKMKKRIESSTNNSQTKTISIYRRTVYRFLQLAAIIVIGLVINNLVSTNDENAEFIAYTSQSGMENIVLPDNSEVKLSKESKIYYPKKFTDKKRQVKLEGEAFFKIEKDKNKPFIIDAQFAQIKVVGTSFKVKAYNDKGIVEVDVAEGTVELYKAQNKNKILVLNKGEQGIIKESELEATKTKKIDKYCKKIIFKDTKLIDVATTLKQAYDVDIDFKNENVKQCKFSLVMYNMSIDTVMSVIQNTHKELIITKLSDNKFSVDSNAKCKN